MSYIKQQMNEAYRMYKNSNFMSIEYQQNLKIIRTHFRFKQREKVKLNQVGTQRKIEMIFRRDRAEF